MCVCVCVFFNNQTCVQKTWKYFSEVTVASCSRLVLRNIYTGCPMSRGRIDP